MRKKIDAVEETTSFFLKNQHQLNMCVSVCVCVFKLIHIHEVE